jgi:hypothetical protein
MAEKKNDREKDLVGLDSVEVEPLTDADLESVAGGGSLEDTNNATTGCITNNATTGCPITPPSDN